MLAEVKDRPGGSGTDGDDHKTGNAQRTLFEEIASEQYGNADAEAVTGERIDEDMDVLGFEAEKARGTAALHLVGEKQGRRGQYSCENGPKLFHNWRSKPNWEWTQELRGNGTDEWELKSAGGRLKRDEGTEGRGYGTPDQDTLRA